MNTTLFVSGFHAKTRAKNLAYEFERYGRLVRLDIPAPKSLNSKPYAFVQFEEKQDAEDAIEEMNGRHMDGYILHIEWAKTPLENRRPFHYQKQRSNRSRSRSPYRREQSISPSKYNNDDSNLPPPRRLRSRSRSPINYQRRRSLSRSPF
ncbi:uncharacterized protein BX663DRAFT_519655 [Cokeromyces recurvatus]|uniref:uncharacterized protein n=1 Tax=Cokeromyces recurvatus TaxID=90255 RepID=UPI002220F0E4|nr:uncharacterized protein BX663DRAFT_519655 [Cokeromyces recurvatus]KAI7899832.1 hypothetical protein BX663DRAFT_519655 [Cokeromyces recurvatus]